MANFIQAQCDACTALSSEKRYEADGTTFKDYWVRFTNENGVYGEFADAVSLTGDTDATRKTNAHAFMCSNCEFEAAPVSTMDAPVDIKDA